MKYFLTGGTGFLGSNILRQLLTKGHDVVALVRNPEKASDIEGKTGLKIVRGDITEKDSMREAMKGCDGVFHVAGWYKVGVKDKSPGKKINIEGTRNVLALVKELNIPKAVYTSTLSVNSDTHGRIVNENYNFNGKHLSEYDRTKAEAHKIAEEFIEGGLPLVIVMPGLIYGPDGTSQTDEAFRMYLRKKLPIIPKEAAYSWGHVNDMAKGHILSMEKAQPGTKYIIAGPSHKLTEAFEIAEEFTGIKAPLAVPPGMIKSTAYLSALVNPVISLPAIYSPEALRVQAGVTYLGDNSRAVKELDFNPRSLKDGFEQTLKYELEKIKSQQS